MSIRSFARLTALALALTAGLATTGAAAQSTKPNAEVFFPSMDGVTQIRGYIWRPTTGAGPFPAVVMMHGCAGAFSKTSGGQPLSATTIEANRTNYINSQFRDWGVWLRDRGYVAILVDSFGPRGETLGVCDIPWEDRTGTALDEVRRRPLDAFGGLKYLRDNAATLKVDTSRVGLVGWSNGASAILSTIAETGPGVWHANGVAAVPGLRDGFKVAAVYYPGCGLAGQYTGTYRPTVPLQMFVGMRDTTTPPAPCFTLQATAAQLAAAANEPTGFDLKAYADAGHSFDQTSNSGWSAAQTALNNAARDDARILVEALFGQALTP